MDTDTLAIFATAIALGVSLHSLMEPGNIRNRVKELEAKLRGERYTSPVQLPFVIDTAAKSFFFGMTFTLLVSGVALGVLWFARPSVDVCLLLIAGVLFVKEGVNTVQVNAYHSEIGTVIAGLPSGEQTSAPQTPA